MPQFDRCGFELETTSSQKLIRRVWILFRSSFAVCCRSISERQPFKSISLEFWTFNRTKVREREGDISMSVQNTRVKVSKPHLSPVLWVARLFDSDARAMMLAENWIKWSRRAHYCCLRFKRNYGSYGKVNNVSLKASMAGRVHCQQSSFSYTSATHTQILCTCSS